MRKKHLAVSVVAALGVQAVLSWKEIREELTPRPSIIAVSFAAFAIRYGLEWAVVSPAKEARDRALQREREIEASSREPFREGSSTRLANLLAETQTRIRKAVVILSKGYRPGKPCNREWGNWEQVDLEVGLEIKEPGLYAFSLAQQLAAGRYVLSWPVRKGEVGGCFVKGSTREFTLEIVRWASNRELLPAEVNPLNPEADVGRSYSIGEARVSLPGWQVKLGVFPKDGDVVLNTS
jgi:hypothetical protein